MKRITAILLFIFVFMLSAYAMAAPNQSANIESARNTENLALEAYKKVLQNKVAFCHASSFRPDEKETVYLDEYLERFREYPPKLIHFSVLDMNGDKIPEVVLEFVWGNANYFYEVLHFYNGEVYGYHFWSVRAFGGLKADGTFHSSGGAGDTSYNKIRFSTTSFEIYRLGYSRSRPGDNTDGSPISFFINNEPVTEDVWDIFITEQRVKENVVWYKISQENIESQLSSK